MKFSGIRKIAGSIYNDMNCDEALRKIYANIAKSNKTKKLDNCFSIVANYCYVLDDSSTQTFHTVVAKRYSNLSWDEAMGEILNKLPNRHAER